MNTRKIGINVVLQMAYRVLVLALPLATSPYLARVLGATVYGEYSFAYSIATYFVTLANLGIAFYGNRKIAQIRDDTEKKNKLFSELLFYHIFISLISIAIYYIFISFYSFGEKANYLLMVIQGAIVAGALFDISWFYFGIEKFKVTVGINSAIKVISAILIFTLVNPNNTTANLNNLLLIYTAIMAGGTLLSMIVLWFPLPHYVKIVKVTPKGILQHTKPLFVLFIPVLANVLFSYMDKTMLGFFSTDTALVGQYENAYKIVEFPTELITSISYVMLPVMAHYQAKHKSGEERIVRMVMFISMYLAIPLTLGLAGISHTFPLLFWGEEFAACSILMGILSIMLFLKTWNGVIRQEYLIPRGHDKTHSISVVVAAVANLILNYLFIEIFKWGAVGACGATIIAYSIIFFIQNGVSAHLKDIRIGTYLKDMIIPLICGGMMFGTVWVFNNYVFSIGWWQLIVTILIGMIVYFVPSVILLKVTHNPNSENIFLWVKNRGHAKIDEEPDDVVEESKEKSEEEKKRK